MIFLYTVSDFSKNALECINLLYESIKINNQIELNVVCNVDPPDCKYNCIVDKSYANMYPGFLKYSKEIPRGYNYYVYLDSDILFFDTVSSILPAQNELSVVFEFESKNPTNNQFFNHFKTHYSPDEFAINAGTFAITDYELLAKTKILCDSSIYPEAVRNAQMEQSAFNHSCHTAEGKSFKNIGEKVKLFAQAYTDPGNKTIFHFCGFEGTMQNKYGKMRQFYDTYKRRYS